MFLLCLKVFCDEVTGWLIPYVKAFLCSYFLYLSLIQQLPFKDTVFAVQRAFVHTGAAMAVS